MTAAAPPPRRRRRRSTSAQGASPAARPDQSVPAEDTPDRPAPSGEPAKPRRRRPPGDGGAERGLRDLVGAGPSQLGVSGALRGRDVDRPTQDDLAEAERDLVIVRRNRPADGR